MTRVPIALVNNSILIEAVVNGMRVDFILDTGDAIGPVFNSRDAVSLQLPVGDVIPVSGAGGATVSYKTIADISVGKALYQNEPSAIDSNLQGYSLLGLPFFLAKCKLMTFDFHHGLLILE